MPLTKYSQPCLTEEDIAAAVQCLRAGDLDAGRRVLELERRVAEALGVPPHWVLATNSATAALWLCQHLLEPRLVYVPALSWASTWSVWPTDRRVYLDVSPDDGILSPPEVYPPVSRALAVPVCLWGRELDCDYLHLLRGQFDYIVVDAAQNFLGPRHGAWLNTGLVTAVVYSLGPLKEVTALHGGLLVCPLADTLRLHCHSGAFGKLPLRAEGHNLRMAEPGAAIALSQLKRFAALREYRWSILSAYQDALGNRLVTRTETHSGHLAVVRLDAAQSRDRVQARLREAGYESGVHYDFPRFLHTQAFPEAARWSKYALTLPCHTEITVDQAKEVADVVSRT